MQPEIRYAEANDLSGIVELYEHLHDADSPPPTTELRDKIANQIFENENMAFVVAQLDDWLVATCFVCAIPNLTRGGRPYALIENVVTHVNYRRRGIGQRVLEKALAFAWERNCYKTMLLTSRTEPEVHAFYERCGFVAGEKYGFIARPPK